MIYLEQKIKKKFLKKMNAINKIFNSLNEFINSDKIEYIRWIPFNEFGNIEYLAKGGFGEVHKATWFGNYEYGYDMIVVLKRLYNSSDNILDILKEVV